MATNNTQRPRRFEPHAGGDRPDDGNAFLPDPGDGPARTSEDLAESLAEGFVEAATTGEDPDEQMLDAGYSEELGGPFVETSASEEVAGGSDPANPADAESEPWPRPVAGLVVDPDIDDMLDRQAAGGADSDDASDDPRSASEAAKPEPPDPTSDVGALNPNTPRGRTPL